jgi:hypothetical protein
MQLLLAIEKKCFNHQIVANQNFQLHYVWQPKMGFGHYLRFDCWMVIKLFWSLETKFGKVACNIFLEIFE